MLRYLAAAAAVCLAIVPVIAQNVQQDTPVQATLRLSGHRAFFKCGEPVRLELVLTTDRPGFVVDVTRTDEASDVLTVSPKTASTDSSASEDETADPSAGCPGRPPC